MPKGEKGNDGGARGAPDSAVPITSAGCAARGETGKHQRQSADERSDGRPIPTFLWGHRRRSSPWTRKAIDTDAWSVWMAAREGAAGNDTVKNEDRTYARALDARPGNHLNYTLFYPDW